MKRFLTWMCKKNEQGVIVSKWLTEEENEQCSKGTQTEFWSWYNIALDRKSSDEFLRGLAWFSLVGLPIVIAICVAHSKGLLP